MAQYVPTLISLTHTDQRVQDTTGGYHNMPTGTFNYLVMSCWLCFGADLLARDFTFDLMGGMYFNPSQPITGPNNIFLSVGTNVSWWQGNFGYNWNGNVTNVLVSIDAVRGIVQCYCNDQAVSVISGGLTGVPVSGMQLYPGFLWMASATSPGTGLGDFFLNAPATFFDLSIASNRRKFINADLSPVNIGSDGSRVFGTPPPIFLTAASGVANNFANNGGTGGPFTILQGPLSLLPTGTCNLNFPPAPPPLGLPPAYLHFLTCCDRAIMAHLYQFTTVGGVQDYFTDFDVDIVYNNVRWKSTGLRFEGLQRKVGVGVSVDEQTLKIWASPVDTMFGAVFLTGAEEGLLDGALVVRKRIVWEFVSGNVAQDVKNPPLFVWTMFTGFMSQIVKGGVAHVEFKVKSALLKLNVNMPRNYYQPGCLWTLYDSGCTLSKASFGVSSTIGSVVGTTAIAPTGGVSPNVGADSLAYFAQGRLLFTSGVNSGLQVLIDWNDGTYLYLAYPLSTLPSPGDSITYYPGCSKSFNTCQAKFNNQANFRGFDKVPPVFVSV